MYVSCLYKLQTCMGTVIVAGSSIFLNGHSYPEPHTLCYSQAQEEFVTQHTEGCGQISFSECEKKASSSDNIISCIFTRA